MNFFRRFTTINVLPLYLRGRPALREFNFIRSSFKSGVQRVSFLPAPLFSIMFYWLKYWWRVFQFGWIMLGLEGFREVELLVKVLTTDVAINYGLEPASEG